MTPTYAHRNQPVTAGRIGAVRVREVGPGLAFVSSRTTAQWASGRRAIGRAVRNCSRFSEQ